MNVSIQTKATVIACDLHGVIVEVPHDGLGIVPADHHGQSLVEVIDPASMEKASIFLNTLQARCLIYGWELNIRRGKRVQLVHCLGFCDGRRIWVIMAEYPIDTLHALRGLSLLPNDQTQALSGGIDNLDLQQSHYHESYYDELTGLYNELSVAERKLAQHNLKLQDLQRELETKQSELLEKNAELETLATTDTLTTLNNRRAFERQLETEYSRAQRHELPLSLTLFDIDHFKGFNDTFGHPAGDDVLRQMGRLLKKASRSSDVVARYGGEEFIILLLNLEESAAVDAAERMRRVIDNDSWPHRAVTASFGVSTLRADTPSMGEFIREADLALYASKQSGRNSVMHFSQIPHNARK